MSLCVTECDLKTFVCWAVQRLPAVWSSDGLEDEPNPDWEFQ